MDNWTIRLFLSACLLALQPASVALAESNILDEAPVLDPSLTRLGLNDADIDDENFEVGAFAGFMSIEHFGTQPVYGVTGSWHLTEYLFFQANYGMASAGTTPYEDYTTEFLGGDARYTDAERDFTYYNISMGFNLLPGEVFIGENWAFNTALYLIAGGGTVDFLGEQEFALNLGAGFRIVTWDWLAVHLAFQDIITDKPQSLNFKNEDGSAHYMQYTLGATVFF